MQQHLTTPAAVALGFGVLGSAWISGHISSLSTMASPALLAAPESTPAGTLTRQWARMFRIGRSAMPKTALTTLLAYLYVGWSVRGAGPAAWGGFVAAGLLTMGIGPYTLAVMSGTNAALEGDAVAAASGKEGLTGDQARGLIAKWRALNAVRSLLPLAGALVGVWSFVNLG